MSNNVLKHLYVHLPTSQPPRHRCLNSIAFLTTGSLLVTLILGACGATVSNNASGDKGLAVKSSDRACEVSKPTAPGGNLVFDVENTGSKVTEFYLLAADGLRILSEVENIGPGLTRKLVVTASEGNYFVGCKPGMVGDILKTAFTVTKGKTQTVTPELAGLLETATSQYRSYVREQSAQLNEKTKLFASAVKANQDDEARRLYPATRMHWERIETVAESFGNLDPQLDAREADLEPGQVWTGWHRIEKDLWPQKAENHTLLTLPERTKMVDKMVADTELLNAEIQKLEFTPDQLGNGSKGLLDEVATKKVTGEEEFWSGTDLWDFQANVDGARVAFEVLQPAVLLKDKGLATLLDEKFEALQGLLDSHKVEDGFKFYADLQPEEIKALADAVNALGEPLSKLTAAVVL
jgi:iron uptake system component EfeO